MTRLGCLFLALNPPEQSNANGHHVSGKASRFYHLLFKTTLPRTYGSHPPTRLCSVRRQSTTTACHSGLATWPRRIAERCQCHRDHVEQVVADIRKLRLWFVCVMHSKVRDALNRYAGFARELDYGMCGRIFPNRDAQFVLNCLPNGTRYRDGPKLEIFLALGRRRWRSRGARPETTDWRRTSGQLHFA